VEERVCALVSLDLETAEVVVTAWQREVERRERDGTPLVVLTEVEKAVAETGPKSHVRVQTDGGDAEQGVWLSCERCGQRRNIRSNRRQDLRREGHDFLLKHGHCPAVAPVRH